MIAEAPRNAASRLLGSSYQILARLLPLPSRGRISSAARSERTAATRTFGATPASAAHRNIAWPEALLAPVMTIFMDSNQLDSGLREMLPSHPVREIKRSSHPRSCRIPSRNEQLGSLGQHVK